MTIFGYLKWHYGRALGKTFILWRNIFFFLFDYFSIRSLLGNFFTPWKRLAEMYPRKFDLKVYAVTFFMNMIMRIVGMIFRAVALVFGLICILAYVILLPVSLLVWLLLPPMIIFLILYGLVLIFQKYD
ncbi:MAG: hypothetical protein WC915_03970 [archaeon]